jgi:hypothetical protein
MTDKFDNKRRDYGEYIESKFAWLQTESATIDDLYSLLEEARREGREQGQTEFAQSQADTIVALMKDSIRQEERERCVAALEKIYLKPIGWSSDWSRGIGRAIDVIKELK